MEPQRPPFANRVRTRLVERPRGLERLLLRRTGTLVAAVALLGLLFSLAVGWRAARDAAQLERLRLESEAEAHLALLRNHLTSREALARAVAASFTPPPRIAGGALSAMDPNFLSLLPDIVSFVWVPEAGPREIPAVLAALRAAGVADPQLLGPAGRPRGVVEARALPVLDIEPKTPANLRSLGLDLWSLPAPREALEWAARRRDAAATPPLELLQLPGVPAFVLYVPVFTRDAARRPVGFLGFAYRYDRLIGAALAGGVSALPFAIADGATTVFRAGAGEGEPRLSRELEFGGRRWTASYWAPARQGPSPALRGFVTAAASLGLVCLALAVIATLAANGQRLRAALEGQAAAEARLRALIEELNHRAKNMLAMVQAVVTRTLRDGGEPRLLQERLSGRLKAMAEATTLLSAAEWRGAQLSELLRASGLPVGERVRFEGDDPLIAPVAAQSIVLVLHELWTNAEKHGALSTAEGDVTIRCSAGGELFRLEWVETGRPAELPARQGFGRQLVERIVPQGLSGRAVLEGGPEGVRYRLEAPAQKVTEWV
jgi:two-component sensor histidine kinase/CHASE1-domain containing sensor protein